MRDELGPIAAGGRHEALDPVGGKAPGLGPMPEFRNPLLDLKKPDTASVNAVRQAIGVTEGTGMSPRHRTGLPGLAGPLPSFEGDGLNPIGRTRVRAGIKLAPIQPS
jgi:hypothetical protein